MPEDAEHSILTAARAVGLTPVLWIGLAQLVAGAAIVVGVTFPVVGFSWVYIPYLTAVVAGVAYLLRLIIGVRGKPEADGVEVVRVAKSFALIALPLAWATIFPAAGFFAYR
jgi:hypothetical protein